MTHGNGGKNRGAAQAEYAQNARGQQRPQHKTAVAADGKDAQPRPLLLTRNLIGEERAFGMKQGRAHAAYGNGQKNGPVAGHKAHQGKTAAGQQHAQRDEPGLGKPVGQQSEHRLNQ